MPLDILIDPLALASVPFFLVAGSLKNALISIRYELFVGAEKKCIVFLQELHSEPLGELLR
jgi:hypothetical protein